MTFTIQGIGPAALGTYRQISVTAACPTVWRSSSISTTTRAKGRIPPGSTRWRSSNGSRDQPLHTGINLHSGDIFNAQLTYDGATLTVVITDTVTKASATQTYTVDIPAIVGSPPHTSGSPPAPVAEEQCRIF